MEEVLRDDEERVFRTGEILHPGEHTVVTDVKEHRLTDRDRLARKIVNRRERMQRRKKLSKTLRVRDPRRKSNTQHDGNLRIRHATEVHVNEITHPHLDDGNEEFLSRSVSGSGFGDDSGSGSGSDRTVSLPEYFDCRVAWGRYCWYPVRDQGNCGSCYIVGLSDTVTNRACIATIYEGGGVESMGLVAAGREAGNTEAKPRPELDNPEAAAPPALSPQAVMSCLAEELENFKDPQLVMGKATTRDGRTEFSPCDGGNLVRVANYASLSGFVEQGSCEGSEGCDACRCASSSTSSCSGGGGYACVPYCVGFSKSDSTRRACPISVSDRISKGQGPPRADPSRRVVTSLAFQTASRNLYRPDVRSDGDISADTMLFPYVANISQANISTIVENVKHIKVELMRRGPVVATLLFNTKRQPDFKFDEHPYDFRNFPDYTPKRQDFENHTIKVIGWATIRNRVGNPQDVWIIQNSWGSSWGGTCRLDNPKLQLLNSDEPHSVVPAEKRPRYPPNPRLRERGYFFFPMADLDFVTGFNKELLFVNSVETRALAPVPLGIRSGDGTCTPVPEPVHLSLGETSPRKIPTNLLIAGIAGVLVILVILILFWVRRYLSRSDGGSSSQQQQSSFQG
jgi:hypothetical protein